MAQFSSDKYTIAWFKLAEFVHRGEKERALGMYRLLAHSLPDEAFAAQLEGDLLLAFRDDRALDAYNRAALSYERVNKAAQAAAIYENILALMPGVLDYMVKIIQLYSGLKNWVKIEQWMREFLSWSIRHQRGEYAHAFLDNAALTHEQKIELHDYFIMQWLVADYQNQEIMQNILMHIVDGYADDTHSYKLANFLARVEAVNINLAAYARTYLQG